MQKFTSKTTDTGSLSNNGSFTLSEGPATNPSMDVKYEYTKGSDYKYNFESNFDLEQLADVKGAKLILKGDNTQSVSGTLEYNNKQAAVSLEGGVKGGKVQFPFSVGLAPVEGLEVGKSYPVKLLRGGKTQSLKVTVAEMPESPRLRPQRREQPRE